jgi:hypothetical protein
VDEEDLAKETLGDRAFDEDVRVSAGQESAHCPEDQIIVPQLARGELVPVSPHGAGTLDQHVWHDPSSGIPKIAGLEKSIERAGQDDCGR